MAVVQVDNVRPVTDAVAEAAVRLVEEPFGVVFRQPGIRGGVVIHHVDDALHAVGVDVVHQALEVLQGAEFRIHRPVIPDGVGAAQLALPGLLSQRMDGQQPDDIRSQGLNPVQILPNALKGTLTAVIADVYRVKHLIAVRLWCVLCHWFAS